MIKDLIAFVGDIFKNRELLIKFSINDFKAKYAGSMLGTFWAFFTPMVTIVVYWFVFEKGLKAGTTTGGIPFIVYLLCGIIVWFFFSDTVVSATNCFREYSYLVKKVIFNYKILPTTKLLSNLYTHLFFIAVTFILTSLYGYTPTLYSLQIIYYLFALIVFISGITWITASLQPFFTDLTQLIGVVLQVLMWGTPILWNVEMLSPTLQTIFKLNPLYYIVIGYRNSFYGEVWFWETPTLTIYFWVFTLVLLLIGSHIYNKLRPHFSDVL